MDDFVEATPNWQVQYSPPPARSAWKRWLLIGGAACAVTLVLGAGVLLGAQVNTTHAAGNAVNNAGSSQVNNNPNNPGAGFGPGGFQGSSQTQATPGSSGPGGQGQCETYTVTAVSGSTITAKSASGTTVTIHTTSSTKYTKSHQTATASAVTVGSTIIVMGTKNTDGSISATTIDVR